MQVIFDEERERAQWDQARYEAGVIAGQEAGAIIVLVELGRVRGRSRESILEDIMDAMMVDAAQAERLYRKYEPDGQEDETGS